MAVTAQLGPNLNLQESKWTIWIYFFYSILNSSKIKTEKPLLWDALEIQTHTYAELHFMTIHFSDVLNTSVSSPH